MSVFGGRFRWVRAASSLIAAGFAIVSCGGRTSTLDVDAYDVGEPGPGGSAAIAGGGSTGRGGTSSGRAGTGAGPSGGAVSTGGTSSTPSGLDPSLAVAPCAKYCPGYGTECSARLNGQDCMAACQAEMNGFGKTCQGLGIKTLNCLTPFFTPNGHNCDQAVQRGLSKCGKLANQFGACKKQASGTPSSPPAPSPTPTPAPTPDPTSCPNTGQVDPTFCTATYSCADGSYVITCKTDPSSQQHTCSCSTPTGVYSLPVDPGALDGNPCPTGAAICFQFARH